MVSAKRQFSKTSKPESDTCTVILGATNTLRVEPSAWHT